MDEYLAQTKEQKRSPLHLDCLEWSCHSECMESQNILHQVSRLLAMGRGEKRKSIMHRFWDCIRVHRAWEFTNKIINWVVYGSGMSRYTVPMHWKCSIFAGYRTEAVSQSGCVVRGIIFRVIWIERNDEIFNDQKWHPQKVESAVWKSLLDYSRVAWGRSLWMMRKSLNAEHQYLRSFDKIWCR